MKVIKKAKIVNLSLNSPKQCSPSIHIPHASIPNFLHTTKKHDSLLNHCYQAIKIIHDQRSKVPLAEYKNQFKKSQPFKMGRSIESQIEVKLSADIAQSMEVILKGFIKLKAEEDQLLRGSSTSKMKLLKRQSASRIMRRNKQNTQELFQEQDDQAGRRYASPNNLSQKLQHRIHELQRQMCYYKQKMEQQSAVIAKLETKDAIIKKKYYDEITRIARSKNIININSQFEKQFMFKGTRNFMLNIDGKTVQGAVKRRTQQDQSEDSMSQPGFTQRKSIKTSPMKFAKYAQTASSFNRNSSLNAKKSTSPHLEEKPMVEKIQKVEQEDKIEEVEIEVKYERKKSVKIAQLKASLQNLQKQRERIYDQLTTINQKYQSKMDAIDQQMLEKLRQIRQQEELLTDEELKMLKDQDFEALQMNGFYDTEVQSIGPQPKLD